MMSRIRGSYKNDPEIQERQQRELEEDDEYFVRTRAEDRSLWIRVSYFIEKYKLLVWLLFSVLLALGFGFKTPSQTYREMNARIDTIAAMERMKSANQSVIEMKVDALITFKCLEVQDRRDLLIARIDCSKFVTPRTQP